MYDFDTLPNRRGMSALKWDVADNELPMWVADMDFKVCPDIEEALLKRASVGAFGYFDVPDAWYDAYIGWWKERHGFSLSRDGLIFTTGAVPAISSMVRKLTTPAEKVLLMTPVYNIFFNSILNNGRVVLECPLSYEVSQAGPAEVSGAGPAEVSGAGPAGYGTLASEDDARAQLRRHPQHGLLNTHELQKYIRRTTGLYLSDGCIYGGNGDHFLRMNIATSHENVKDGLNRLKTALDNL